MAPLGIDVVVTEPALEEAVALTTPKESWVRRILYYWGCSLGVAQGAVLGWYGLRGLVGYSWGPDRDLVRFLFSAAITAIPIGVTAWIFREMKKRRRLLRSMSGPVKFLFTSEGISGSTPEGYAFNHGWAYYVGFYVGRRGIVCPVCPGREKPAFLLVPIETLPPGQISDIRALLGSHLSEFDSSQLRSWVVQK